MMIFERQAHETNHKVYQPMSFILLKKCVHANQSAYREKFCRKPWRRGRTRRTTAHSNNQASSSGNRRGLRLDTADSTQINEEVLDRAFLCGIPPPPNQASADESNEQSLNPLLRLLSIVAYSKYRFSCRKMLLECKRKVC